MSADRFAPVNGRLPRGRLLLNPCPIMEAHSRSSALFFKAFTLISGGVNSSVRAFLGVGGEPFFVDRAEGAHIWDVDGQRYVDFVGT